MIFLSEENPFAQGGNRLCFVHPDDASRCIKVRRPDFTLADCRRKKKFPKNLRPLTSFDDNLEEFNVLKKLSTIKGDSIFVHIYKCFGFIDTDMGKGLVTELIKDADGRISRSLKHYIWEEGYTDNCRDALVQLESFWLNKLIPSRDLLTHNIVVQMGENNQIIRLVVIDGLGSPHLIPFQWFPVSYQKRYVSKKIKRLHCRIDEFIDNCNSGKKPSSLGILQAR